MSLFKDCLVKSLLKITFSDSHHSTATSGFNYISSEIPLLSQKLLVCNKNLTLITALRISFKTIHFYRIIDLIKVQKVFQFFLSLGSLINNVRIIFRASPNIFVEIRTEFCFKKKSFPKTPGPTNSERPL